MTGVVAPASEAATVVRNFDVALVALAAPVDLHAVTR